MGVRIVTDTGCDLPARLEAELKGMGVRFVPFLFHFGLDALKDKTISMREFIARADVQWPTTAVPSSETFVQVFRECIEAGHRVLCITLTGRHSACYATALLASQEFPESQVTVFDSGLLSVAQGVLVLAAARAAAAGASLERILDLLRDLQRRVHLFITLDTVKYLVRGGRASRLAGGLAELLRIRPILTFVDGELTMIERARGRKSAKRRLLELVAAHLPAEALGVAHILCEDEGREMVEELAQQTGRPADSILFAETGMVIATHGGPGTLGVMAVRAAR